MAIKKNRQVNVEERNEKIEHMGLIELKKYLCFKNNQNPEKCDGCPGIKNCKAGQRAVVLLSEREIRKMEENKSTKGIAVEDRVEEARKKFIVVCGQKDMIQYLIDHDGNTRNAAREKLKHWGKKYTDIAEQFNFWEKFNSLSKINYPTNGFNDQKTIEAKRKYREAAAQDNPIAFMMEKYGMDSKKAHHNFKQWEYRYGKIEKEEQKVEEDEVSVEDFLKDIHEKPVEQPVDLPKEEPVRKYPRPVTDKEMDFYGELNAKFYELEQEKEKLEARIAWIKQAQDALAMTAKVFDTELGKNEQKYHAG